MSDQSGQQAAPADAPGAAAAAAPTQVAREGMIGIVLAQSPEFVAPHGAKQAIFGTNPIAVGIPSAEGADPMVMDMATAAYAWFGLLEAKTAGLPIPGDVAYNARGELTTDPNEVRGRRRRSWRRCRHRRCRCWWWMALQPGGAPSTTPRPAHLLRGAAADRPGPPSCPSPAPQVLSGGAIRTFDGGYKSSNLALMVELLAGPLVGAAVADKLSERNWGNLVVVIDPQCMGNKELILQRMQVRARRGAGATGRPCRGRGAGAAAGALGAPRAVVACPRSRPARRRPAHHTRLPSAPRRW
jgi:LDH2 family malate/lactate/ureidoglycolate dehydrogenase